MADDPDVPSLLDLDPSLSSSSPVSTNDSRKRQISRPSYSGSMQYKPPSNFPSAPAGHMPSGMPSGMPSSGFPGMPSIPASIAALIVPE